MFGLGYSAMGPALRFGGWITRWFGNFMIGGGPVLNYSLLFDPKYGDRVHLATINGDLIIGGGKYRKVAGFGHIVLGGGLLFVAAAPSGCMSQPASGIALQNKTGVDLEYHYLVRDPRADEGAPAPAEYEVMQLAPGGSEDITPIPAEDGCTIAPLVARRTDGSEVARLPTGTCWDPLFTWTLDEDDL